MDRVPEDQLCPKKKNKIKYISSAEGFSSSLEIFRDWLRKMVIIFIFENIYVSPLNLLEGRPFSKSLDAELEPKLTNQVCNTFSMASDN